jgi:hypothetical protein
VIEDEEKAERRLARSAEQRTKEVCCRVAVTCAVLGVVALASMACAAWRATGVLQPAAAFLLATSVAAAARCIVAPAAEVGLRRAETRTTASSSPLRMWLGCFAAIWSGITASQVLPGLISRAIVPAPRAIRVRAPAGTFVRVTSETRSSRISLRLPEAGAGQKPVSVRVIR